MYFSQILNITLKCSFLRILLIFVLKILIFHSQILHNIGKIQFKCYWRHTADVVSQVLQLLCVVQHLNSLCVGIIAHRERSGNGGSKFPVKKKHIYCNWKNAEGKGDFRDGLIAVTLPDFFFGVLKAFSHKVNWLELCNGILLQAGLLRLEGQKFGLVRQTVLQDIRITSNFQSVLHFSFCASVSCFCFSLH